MRHFLSALALAAVALPGNAVAQVTFYTNQTLFNAAAGPQTSTAFPGGGNGQSVGTSYTIGNATFSSPQLLSLYSDPDFSESPNYLAVINAPVTVTFSAPVTAFSATLGSFAGPRTSTVTVDEGSSTVAAVPSAPNSQFFGVTSSTSFSSLTFTVSDELDFIGGFTTSAAAAPEPASWALMIGGFGVVGAAMRRRRKVAALA